VSGGRQAGYTAFSVGMTNNRLTYIPIEALVKNSPRMLDPTGRTWERVLSVTGQPNTARRLHGSVTNALHTRTTL
jgi:6-phosphofructokinase 1